MKADLKHLLFSLVFAALASLFVFNCDIFLEEAPQPKAGLVLDKEVENAIHSGLDKAAKEFGLKFAILKVTDSDNLAVTACGSPGEACTVTFGSAIHKGSFIDHPEQATAIAIHEMGHAVQADRGSSAEWIVYSSVAVPFFIIFSFSCFTNRRKIVCFLTILSVCAVVLMFTGSYTWVLGIYTVIGILGSFSGLIFCLLDWKFDWVAIKNSIPPFFAVVVYLLISHINDGRESFADAVATCLMGSPHPLMLALQSDMQQGNAGLQYVFDAWHPVLNQRLDALDRLSDPASRDTLCKRVLEDKFITRVSF